MHHTLQRSVAIGLTVCLLLLGGVASAQAVEHAGHHAHHQAATHATVLCSWMCAAGQVLEGIAVVFQAGNHQTGVVAIAASEALASAVRPTTPSRGPPVFSI